MFLELSCCKDDVFVIRHIKNDAKKRSHKVRKSLDASDTESIGLGDTICL